MSDALAPQVGDVVIVVAMAAEELAPTGYARPGDVTVIRDAPDPLRSTHPQDYWVDMEERVGVRAYPGRAWGWVSAVRRPTEAELAAWVLEAKHEQVVPLAG